MFDVAIERLAAHLRHPHIAENEVVAASGEQFERLRPVLRCLYIVAIELKQTCECFPQNRFIVHEQMRYAISPPFSGNQVAVWLPH